MASDCRPVEPPVIEANTKTANNQLLQSLKDYPFGEPSNCPEISDSSSEPIQVGDSVRFVLPRHQRNGTEGVVSSEVDLVSSGCNYWFESNCGQFSCYCTASQLERIDKADPINPSHYKQFVIVTDNDGNQTLYVDGVLRDGDNTVYGCDVADAANGCAIKIELRDVDFIVEHWPISLSDLGAEAKQPESSPLAPSPCMGGVDVDQFVDGIMDARGRTSDPVNPSHYKQGGIECIEAIKAATGEGFPDYLRGNVLKYLWRWPKKNGVDDLKKARWYLDRLIKEVGE